MSLKIKKLNIKNFWCFDIVANKEIDIQKFFSADICFACGLEILTEKSHIVARNLGGSNNVNNIHLLCLACHKNSEFLSEHLYWEWFYSRTMLDSLCYYALCRGFNISNMSSNNSKLLEELKALYLDGKLDVYRKSISMCTKRGLEKAKKNGKQLGRPKGTKNKKCVLEPYKEEILEYLELGLKVTEIMRLINSKLEKPLTYGAYRYFVEHNKK